MLIGYRIKCTKRDAYYNGKGNRFGKKGKVYLNPGWAKNALRGWGDAEQRKTFIVEQVFIETNPKTLTAEEFLTSDGTEWKNN